MTGVHGRTWKSHQYLALLFTEHYLSRYFADPEQLRAELNEAKHRNRLTWPMPDYSPEDLRTIAFQSATGSGKTLVMHAHILQYRHWLDRSGKRLNNVILVTPNEQMSAQHERDLRESGLHARIFSGDAGADLFAPIEIIDLNKLAERKGVKRVAVRDFGENNLVLVDEGHLGASGKVWRERRGELGARRLRLRVLRHLQPDRQQRTRGYGTPTGSACCSTTPTTGSTRTATARTTPSRTCRPGCATRTATCISSAVC